MHDALRATIRTATAEGRRVLLEHEVLALVAAAGLPVPRHRFLDPAAVTRGELGELDGQRAVLKVVAAEILHKSDVGGVRFLERSTPAAVRAAAERIVAGLPGALRDSVRGFLLAEEIAYERGFGRELMLGLRGTADFGPVCSVGLGGTAVEALAAAARPGQTTALFAPGITSPARLRARIDGALFARWICGAVRGVAGLIAADDFAAELARWVAGLEQIAAAVAAEGWAVGELELNPIVLAGGRLLPLDALLRLAAPPPAAPAVPLDKLRRALAPRSVALVGVSTTMNVGRIILRSLLEGGFPPQRLAIVRAAGPDSIDGVRCVPSIAACGAPVDLLIVAVAAAAAPQVLAEVIDGGAAQGVLLIPGGMGETAGGKGIEQQLVAQLAAAPAAQRPAVIGNNSLGLVCRAAQLDSLFIPRDKLPRAAGARYRDAALISQSGAFLISQLTKLDLLCPELQLSVGNQIDARLSHFLELAAAQRELRTIGLYIEGLKPGDGARLAGIVQQLTAEGRDVVLYKAGRTRAGQAAALGHTAAVAGDYAVFETLLADAGALVAQTLADFTDLLRLSATLGDRALAGGRAALLSNAGYEAVALADSIGGAAAPLQLARPGDETLARLRELLAAAGLATLVNATNPLDVTPMADDAVHEQCMRALLDDPGVDLGVFGNVPLTSRLQSLPPGLRDDDRLDAPQGYAARTIALFREASKPFVLVIDAGALYDPLVAHLQAAGLPVFRTADRALRVLARYAAARLAR